MRIAMRSALLLALLAPVLALAQGVQPPLKPAFDATRPAIDNGQRSGPLISQMACDLTWLRWSGSTMVDLKVSGWSMAGVVPQTQKAGRIPASAGAFSDANYYSLGTGSDVGDVATVSACIVLSLDSLPGATERMPLSDGLANTDGWYASVGGNSQSNRGQFVANSAGSGTAGVCQTANAAITGLNVLCGGFTASGNTVYAKLNLGTVATKAKGSAMTLGSSRIAYVGRYTNAGYAFTVGKVHEVCVSSSVPSDALFTAVMTEVKTKTGTTAW